MIDYIEKMMIMTSAGWVMGHSEPGHAGHVTQLHCLFVEPLLLSETSLHADFADVDRVIAVIEGSSKRNILSIFLLLRLTTADLTSEGLPI